MEAFAFLSRGKGANVIASEIPARITIVNVPTLIFPGIGNSDHAHWQTLWESANSAGVRVQQRDYNNPVCHKWVNVLEQAVAEIGESLVLVAHGLGCLCVAHWALNVVTGRKFVRPQGETPAAQDLG